MAVVNSVPMVKVLLIGDSGVGKSNLLSRLCSNEFTYEYIPTIGIKQGKYHMKDDGKVIISAHVLEIGGQECQTRQEIRSRNYQDIEAAVIVYELKDYFMSRNVEKWHNDLRTQIDRNIIIMVVGTKADKRRLCQSDDADKSYAKSKNFLYMETSALEMLNVENAFKRLLTQIYYYKKALDIDDDAMVQRVNYGGEDGEITKIPRLFPRESDLVMTFGSLSRDFGHYNGPRLSSNNFPIWKNRMICSLNSVDSKLVETIKEGRHTPSKEKGKWSDEDEQKVALDYKAMDMLGASLPDDIYRFVMYCESAKDMWDRLIVLFEGTEEVRECRKSHLIQQYELFAFKPGESLTEIYTRFHFLINDLKQHHKTFNNDEILIKFLNSLPEAWKTKATIIRETENLKTMSLESLHGHLLAHKLETKYDTLMKERVG